MIACASEALPATTQPPPLYSILGLPSMPWGRRVVAGEHSEGGDQHGNRQMVPAFVLKGPLFTTFLTSNVKQNTHNNYYNV